MTAPVRCFLCSSAVLGECPKWRWYACVKDGLSRKPQVRYASFTEVWPSDPRSRAAARWRRCAEVSSRIEAPKMALNLCSSAEGLTPACIAKSEIRLRRASVSEDASAMEMALPRAALFELRRDAVCKSPPSATATHRPRSGAVLLG